MLWSDCKLELISDLMTSMFPSKLVSLLNKDLVGKYLSL